MELEGWLKAHTNNHISLIVHALLLPLSYYTNEVAELVGYPQRSTFVSPTSS
jgi:hypothetical protein